VGFDSESHLPFSSQPDKYSPTSRGMRPATDYAAFRRPRLTRRQFWGTVVRTVGYTVTALICSAFIHQVDHAWLFAIRVGLVTGIVTGVE